MLVFKICCSCLLKAKRSFSLACHLVSRKSEFFEISLHFKSALPKPCGPLLESTFEKKGLSGPSLLQDSYVCVDRLDGKMGTRACFTLGPKPKKSVDQFNLSMMATSWANFS